MINYKQLYYFWNVAKAGSIARASESLHLTPQTLSGQIGELERNLNTKLFHRVGRRLELTEAGKLARSRADDIFQIGKELESLLHHLPNGGEIVFRIGLADVIPKSIAYRLLAPAIQLNDPIRIICQEDKQERLFAQLAIHKLDLVISDRPLPNEFSVKGYNHPLGHSDIDFFATQELAARYSRSTTQSLHAAPLLLPTSNTLLREALDHWFSEHGVQPRIVGEFDDTALMKAFGQAGAGIFPAPTVIADEIQKQYGVIRLGITTSIQVQYFAISVARRLTHPAVVAISQSAKQNLFDQPTSS